MEDYQDNAAKVQIGCVSNVYVRQMHFMKAGDKEHGHQHEFDHITLLAAGSLRVQTQGRVTDFVAPHMIFIKAENVHELTALADNTVAYCIHALRDGDAVGDILDPAMIPEGVDPTRLARPLIKS